MRRVINACSQLGWVALPVHHCCIRLNLPGANHRSHDSEKSPPLSRRSLLQFSGLAGTTVVLADDNAGVGISHARINCEQILVSESGETDIAGRDFYAREA